MTCYSIKIKQPPTLDYSICIKEFYFPNYKFETKMKGNENYYVQPIKIYSQGIFSKLLRVK